MHRLLHSFSLGSKQKAIYRKPPLLVQLCRASSAHVPAAATLHTAGVAIFAVLSSPGAISMFLPTP